MQQYRTTRRTPAYGSHNNIIVTSKNPGGKAKGFPFDFGVAESNDNYYHTTAQHCFLGS